MTKQFCRSSVAGKRSFRYIQGNMFQMEPVGSCVTLGRDFGGGDIYTLKQNHQKSINTAAALLLLERPCGRADVHLRTTDKKANCIFQTSRKIRSRNIQQGANKHRGSLDGGGGYGAACIRTAKTTPHRLQPTSDGRCPRNNFENEPKLLSDRCQSFDKIAKSVLPKRVETFSSVYLGEQAKCLPLNSTLAEYGKSVCRVRKKKKTSQ